MPKIAKDKTLKIWVLQEVTDHDVDESGHDGVTLFARKRDAQQFRKSLIDDGYPKESFLIHQADVHDYSKR